MIKSEALLRHLDIDYTEPVRDPLWGNIMLSPGMKSILSSGTLQKLNKIKQLGPSYHVYPGATHTRLCHSIGVFHISKRILRQLLMSQKCPLITEEGALAFLCASLLHDMGHFPYAHSLKELPLLDHEILTGQYILSDPLFSVIKESLKIDPAMAAAIVDKNITKDITDEILFFRNILSGVLDPDKLDYLNRDAYFCGVPYGIQDIDFIISNMTPHEKTDIAVLEAGLPAVENLLFSKYLMYRAVYWHKTVRSATAMVKKALFLGIKDNMIKPDELYGLDDETLFMNYKKSSYPPFSLLKRVSERNIYKTALEIPFDIENSAHHCLTFLNKRLLKENEILLFIRQKYSPQADDVAVIIDIPEQISFEIDMPVVKENKASSFISSGTVFNKPVIKGFTGVLRKIRLFLPEEIINKISASDQKLVEDLINNGC